MKRTRRYFSRVFKAEAVRQLMDGKQSAAGIARELGIDGAVLRRWRDEFETERTDQARRTPSRMAAADHEELQRLRRENAVLREEREIPEKATAFFAREVP
jgi:transposase